MFAWYSWSGRGWLAPNLHVGTRAAAHAPLCSVTSSNPTRCRQAGWLRADSTHSLARSLTDSSSFARSLPKDAEPSLPLHFLYLISPLEAQLPPPPASPHLCHCSRATAASWEAAAESPLAWCGKSDRVSATEVKCCLTDLQVLDFFFFNSKSRKDIFHARETMKWILPSFLKVPFYVCDSFWNHCPYLTKCLLKD